MVNLEKTGTIPRNCLHKWKDRQIDRQKDREAWFHRNLPATVWGSKTILEGCVRTLYKKLFRIKFFSDTSPLSCHYFQVWINRYVQSFNKCNTELTEFFVVQLSIINQVKNLYCILFPREYAVHLLMMEKLKFDLK